jgi:uncharacterized protein
MLILISPSKTLDFKPQKLITEFTIPDYLDRSEKLIKKLRKFKAKELSRLMDISLAIAELNVERYALWNVPFTTENAKQAVLAFKGDVYLGLKAETFSESDFNFAQDHLRILSGLYGILRPWDLIQPYRLEMGIKLKTTKTSNLYQFWGDEITRKLNVHISTMKVPAIINLASVEYSKTVNVKNLKSIVITPEFREHKNGNYDMIGVYAKKARGLMSRFIIQNKLNDSEDLKAFNDEGYIFNSRVSKGQTWVFTRG